MDWVQHQTVGNAKMIHSLWFTDSKYLVGLELLKNNNKSIIKEVLLHGDTYSLWIVTNNDWLQIKGVCVCVCVYGLLLFLRPPPPGIHLARTSLQMQRPKRNMTSFYGHFALRKSLILVGRGFITRLIFFPTHIKWKRVDWDFHLIWCTHFEKGSINFNAHIS